MKAVIWDIAPCSSYMNPPFVGTHQLRSSGSKISRASNQHASRRLGRQAVSGVAVSVAGGCA
jgi:hypothetical protein